MLKNHEVLSSELNRCTILVGEVKHPRFTKVFGSWIPLHKIKGMIINSNDYLVSLPH